MKIQRLAGDILQNLKSNAVRFPLPVICISILFLFWLTKPNEGKLVGILSAGFFWFGGAQLFAESRKKSFAEYLSVSVPVFGVTASYMYLSSYNTSLSSFIVFGLITFVTVAPFLNKNSTDLAFYNFNYKLWIGFFYTILLSLLFCGGLSAIFATIDILFGTNIGGRMYSVIWAFGIAFLAPYYALSWVSKEFDSKESVYIPKGIKFILTYILVPFGVIYLAILYSYGLKILVEWQLPNGRLGSMICVFGAVGAIVHLAIYPLRDSGGYLVKLFHRYFCFAFLPLIVLLLVAIRIRISEYGLTEGRYTIVLAAIWFAVTSIVGIVRNDNNSMKYGPAILSAMLLLASFGPWGAAASSERSQVARLETLLTENEILQNGKIALAQKVISTDDYKEVVSIVGYLTKTGKLDAIKPWFAKDKNIHKLANKRGHGSEYDGYKIIEDLGLNAAARRAKETIIPAENNSANDLGAKFAFATNIRSISSDSWAAGYDPQHISRCNVARPTTPCDDSPVPVHYREGNILVIKFGDSDRVDIDLEKMAKDIKAMPNKNSPEITKIMTVETESKDFKLKVFIKNIDGDQDKDGIKIRRVNYELLYEMK